MREFIEKLAKKNGINDVENTQYVLDSTKDWCWPNELNRSDTDIKRFRYRKLPYKKIYPMGEKIDGGNLLIFDVIWSDDKSLVPASLLGFATNSYKDFKYRLLPKQPNEKYQFIYEIWWRTLLTR